jgi:sulfonate transport system substrate-binding protein
MINKKYFQYRKSLSSLVITSLIVAFLVGCTGLFKPAQQVINKVTMGIQASPAMTLVMVAQDKGFFKEEGVDVEIKQFTAGKLALQAFLGKSLDFAVSGEVPVALASLQGNEIKVVSQVVENTIKEVRVVARKDGVLNDPKKYFKAKKRKVATSIGGGPEFFTYEFLNRYGIGKDEVEIISQSPQDMPAALEAGSVDAISIFDPFAFIAEKKLKEKAITFADESLYSEFYVLNAHPEQLSKNPEVVESILKAFVKSADFIAKDPESSKQIMQRYTKLDRDVIDGIWKNFVFKPALTPKLIEYWNRQGDWAKKTNKVKSDIPAFNFRGVIDDRFLKKIKPDAVKI